VTSLLADHPQCFWKRRTFVDKKWYIELCS